uniref:MSP domain-containing protein n=1 Tax=Panagrolaimus sp. ES5 TaxID=591445 RepID=A0AC34FBH1_9BILA
MNREEYDGINMKDEEKRNLNSSTLSIHISNYEKAVEANKNEPKSQKNEMLKIFTCRPTKIISNHDFSFEIARQASDKNMKSEVMEFRSSKKLINPNDTTLFSKKNDEKKDLTTFKDNKNTRIPDLLIMSPLNSLVLKGPFTDGAASLLSLSNPTDSIISFKLLSTNTRMIHCIPNKGFVRPQSTVYVQVMLKEMEETNAFEDGDPKLMVKSIIIQSDLKLGDEQDLVWQDAYEQEDLMVQKLPIKLSQHVISQVHLSTVLMGIMPRVISEAVHDMYVQRRRKEDEFKEIKRLLKFCENVTTQQQGRLNTVIAMKDSSDAEQQIKGALTVFPSKDIRLAQKFKNFCYSYLFLTNASSKNTFFKVFSNNQMKYGIHPSGGLLKPGESATIIIFSEESKLVCYEEFANVAESFRLRDKFIVQSSFTYENETSSFNFWQSRAPFMVFSHELDVLCDLGHVEDVQSCENVIGCNDPIFFDADGSITVSGETFFEGSPLGRDFAGVAANKDVQPQNPVKGFCCNCPDVCQPLLNQKISIDAIDSEICDDDDPTMFNIRSLSPRSDSSYMSLIPEHPSSAAVEEQILELPPKVTPEFIAQYGKDIDEAEIIDSGVLSDPYVCVYAEILSFSPDIKVLAFRIENVSSLELSLKFMIPAKSGFQLSEPTFTLNSSQSIIVKVLKVDGASDSHLNLMYKLPNSKVFEKKSFKILLEVIN